MADKRAEQTSLNAINKAINGIKRSAVKLNEAIHNTGIMIMEHTKTFGDATAAGRLVDSLPMTHRRKLIIDWFDAFSPIGVNKDAKSGGMKGFLRGKTEERDALWNIEGAKATPFYAMPDAKREPDIPTYEAIHNNIISFTKRLETRINGTENTPGMPEGDEKKKALAEVEALKKAVAA